MIEIQIKNTRELESEEVSDGIPCSLVIVFVAEHVDSTSLSRVETGWHTWLQHFQRFLQQLGELTLSGFRMRSHLWKCHSDSVLGDEASAKNENSSGNDLTGSVLIQIDFGFGGCVDGSDAKVTTEYEVIVRFEGVDWTVGEGFHVALGGEFFETVDVRTEQNFALLQFDRKNSLWSDENELWNVVVGIDLFIVKELSSMGKSIDGSRLWSFGDVEADRSFHSHLFHIAHFWEYGSLLREVILVTGTGCSQHFCGN